jgi:probable phosphoglycerate mutase
MRILLARHGETSWNVEGRHQGQGYDIALSDVGRRQAEALAGRLKGLSLAHAAASPLLRAKETAELALGEQASKLKLDPALMEIAHGDWEGRLPSEIRELYPDLQRAWREDPAKVTLPGGESLQLVLDRAWPAFCQACQGLGEEDHLLVVTHDGVNRVLLCRILGLPLDRVWAFRQAPTCLNLLEGPEPNRLSVVRLNDASHITPLFGEVVHRKL